MTHDFSIAVAREQIERFRKRALATESADLASRYIAAAEMIVMDLQIIEAIEPDEADRTLRDWAARYIEDDVQKLDASDVPAFLWGERMAPFPRDLRVPLMRRFGLVDGGA